MKKINQFFILGNPRSGTSMFRMMLNSHPDIVVPPECGFSHWLSSKYKFADFTQEPIYVSFVEDVYNSKKFETWGITKADILTLLLDNKPQSYQNAIKCVYLAFAHSRYNGKSPSLVGDKNNYYINHVKELKTLFPEAKFILLVRDGRDVACSYLQIEKSNIASEYKPSLPQSIEAIANEWVTNNKRVLNEFDDNLLITRYEDIVSFPEKELKRVCEYLDVEFNESMLNFYKNNDEPEEFLQWKANTKNKANINSVGKFTTILPLESIIFFEKIAKEYLSRFKYSLLGDH